MLQNFKNNNVFLFSLFFVFTFWIIESLLHAHIFDEKMHFEIIPHDMNELWMRLIIFILIPSVGYLAGRQIKLEKKIQEEKMLTLKASIISMNEMVGNTLSLMSHYCDDFIKAGEADMAAVESMKEIIKETFVGLEHLSELDIMIEREKTQVNVRQN